jgi:hypothetical protein
MEQFLETWDRKPILLRQMIVDIKAIDNRAGKLRVLLNRLESMGFLVDIDQMVVPVADCKEPHPNYYRSVEPLDD